MKLSNFKTIVSAVSLVSLVGTIFYLTGDSWKFAVLSLLVFTISSNISTAIIVTEKISQVSGIGNLVGMLQDVKKTE
jgi:uncharacterized membrane protein YGL010W